jgi:rod shape-determining protein MreC
VAATAVLLSDRRETFQAEAYGAGRSMSDKVLTPVGDALSAPGRWTGAGVDTVRGYFFAVSENRALKAELQEMKQWHDVAVALKDENERYRTLLGLKTDPPIPMVAARIVTDSRGPFANTRLANAGYDKGVAIGQPVMSENGLVGRIIGVSDTASRVLLLTDIASRTPVMVDRTNARAILTGDGGPNPRLDYLRGQSPVKEGDRVLTSGDGGLLPRGLPVGTAVKGLDGRWRVVLASDRAAIDFVRILLFKDFTQLVDARELAKSAVPPPTAGSPTWVDPQATLAAAKAPATGPGSAPAAEKAPAKPAATAPAPAPPKPATPATAGATTAPAAKPPAGATPAAKTATPPAKPAAAPGASETKAPTVKPPTAKPPAAKPPAAKPATAKAAPVKPAPAKPKPAPEQPPI